MNMRTKEDVDVRVRVRLSRQIADQVESLASTEGLTYSGMLTKIITERIRANSHDQKLNR